METRAVGPNCEHEVPAVGQPCLQPFSNGVYRTRFPGHGT